MLHFHFRVKVESTKKYSFKHHSLKKEIWQMACKHSCAVKPDLKQI